MSDPIRDTLDPSRSLEAWLRKHGADDAQLAAVRHNLGTWLEAMKLRQQDGEVRREQDMRALRYLSAIPRESLSAEDSVVLAELRVRRGAR